jgi:hypothetical protein
MSMHESFQASPTTIGRLLAGDPLAVPRFQREYSWTEDEVDKLLRDFSKAKRQQPQPQAYFLGSVVLASANPAEVIDGQQRLATSTILLAVIRDLLIELKREPQAESIDTQYLNYRAFQDGGVSARLTLNVDDRAFFWQAIICRPGSTERESARARFDSHRRILDAREVVTAWLKGELQQASDAADQLEILSRWRTFLHENAIVAALVARDRKQALRMFVTLNDRGLQVSQTDLVKNHLFERAQESFESVQSAWTQVRSTLEALDLERVSLDYLRHFLAMLKGLVREEEIFDVVENTVATERDSVRFSEQLASRASDYTAILLSSHPRWKGTPYGAVISKRLSVLNEELQVKFHRALLLAVVANFEEKEIAEALKWITSIAVRLLVVGGSRSGKTEEAIGTGALKIASKEIKTAAEMAQALSSIAPSDTEFQVAFTEKTTDKSRLARYLLRSIEAKWRREDYPETVIVEDTNIVNLEHILPKKYPKDSQAWSHFTEDEHRAYAFRLGNLALMRATDNSVADRAPFSEKRPILAKSVNVMTTQDVIENTSPTSRWEKEDIHERQARLAMDAPEIWPITGY